MDTDGDGTPDFQDSDSDDDGIPDSIEGFPAPANGEPADSDGDGVPDFRDDDSDGNGILDGVEPDEDLDDDGHPAFRDRDDDGDYLDDTVEIGASPSSPTDTDGDGVPDYRDVDSDNDTIGDLHEARADSDGDGLLDRFDADSDGDGFTDAEEAGDGDTGTPPIDTDGDLAPDFRDADADGDGLGDADERDRGTDPRNADSDGDGVSDLVEIAACPAGDASCADDATNPSSSPRVRGDFVFFEPYMMPPLPERDTLDFATNLQVADVYFLVDTTGSMGSAIADIQDSLSRPGGIIESVRSTIPDTWFGVGEYRDYGDGAGIFRNRQDLTASVTSAQSAINALTASGGGDWPEAGFQAAWSVATGMGFTVDGSPWVPDRRGCPSGTSGYPCWRSGAVPILVMVGDAPFHNGPPGAGDVNPYSGYFGYERLGDITDARIRAIGVTTITTTFDDSSEAHFRRFATDTGAVDAAGDPLVSTISCSSSSCAVGRALVDQIAILASQTPLDISIEYVDDAADAVDSYAAFVSYIEANTAGDSARGCIARPAEDTNGDGHADTFRDVTPGNRVCFDIIVKQNDTVMPAPTPQVFKATLRVLGDGFTELDTRDIFFLVPGIIEGPDGPE